MIRRLRAKENPSVIVQIEDDLRVAVPCWMLEASSCGLLRIEASPKISLDALVELRALIDVHSNPHNGSIVCANAQNNEEPKNEFNSQTGATANDA